MMPVLSGRHSGKDIVGTAARGEGLFPAGDSGKNCPREALRGCGGECLLEYTHKEDPEFSGSRGQVPRRSTDYCVAGHSGGGCSSTPWARNTLACTVSVLLYRREPDQPSVPTRTAAIVTEVDLNKTKERGRSPGSRPIGQEDPNACLVSE